MKYSATRKVVGVVGIMAAGVWPMAAWARGSTQTGSSGSGTGTGSSGGQPSSDTDQGTGSSQDTGAYGGSRQQGAQQPSSETGAFGGGQQQGAGGTAAEAGKLDTLGRNFLNQASQQNAGELRIAQLAESKAQDPAVRSLAQGLVQQHQRVSSQLQQLGSQYKVDLPASPMAAQQREYQDLSRLSGEQFDRQFLSTIIQEHQKVISNFEKIADSENVNPQVQSWAIQTLPGLRSHLLDARNVRKQIEGGQQQGEPSKQGQPQGTKQGAGMEGGGTSPQPSGGGGY